MTLNCPRCGTLCKELPVVNSNKNGLVHWLTCQNEAGCSWPGAETGEFLRSQAREQKAS